MRRAAILLLGGQGTRFQDGLPKQFHRLSGKRLYQYPLDTLKSCGAFDQIILVVPDAFRHLIEESDVTLVSGGETRQESSYRGLLACHPDTAIALLHDGVRPFLTERIIRDNIEAAERYGAVDTCIPSNDTIVHSLDSETIAHIPHRAHYLRGQTPQTFHYSLILDAHRRALKGNATDDCQLVLQMGHPVHIVSGSEENIKITYPIDLFLAEHLFRERRVQTSHGCETLTGKLFAITGGLGGIGSAIAAKLKELGAHCLIIGHQGGDYCADLSQYAAVEALFTQIERDHGPLDGLIHCAGRLQIKDLDHLSHDEIDALIAVNFNSAVYCSKLAPLKSGGHLILISSSSYFRGRKSYALYSAAKAAIVNFGQAISEERPDLRVNICIPARTNTAMRAENFPGEDPHDLLTPGEVAQEVIAMAQSEPCTGLIWEIRKTTKP